MRSSLMIAAVLTILVAAAHSYLGERYILIRLFRRTELPKLFGGVAFTKQTLRFAWHITSIAWLGLASLIAVLASAPGEAQLTQARLIAGVFGSKYPPAEPGALVCEPLKAACQRAANAAPVIRAT